MLAAFLALMILCTLILMFSTHLAVSSKRWPKIKGLVIEAGVSQRKTKASGSEISYFAPQISYEYFVKNKKYNSTRIDSRLLAYDNEAEAASIANSFPSKTEIDVYYHPLFPSISCLRTGLHGKFIYIALYFFCLAPTVSIIWNLI